MIVSTLAPVTRRALAPTGVSWMKRHDGRMTDDRQTPMTVSSPEGNTETLIGQGSDAFVTISSGGATVRKRYAPRELEQRIRLADREAEALKNAQSLLTSIDAVETPDPHRVDRETGDLIMGYSDGVPLHQAIAWPEFGNTDSLKWLAHNLADAIITLSDAIPVNQLDFSARNTLIARDPLSIVLIDFTPRDLPSGIPQCTSALEISLASLITSAATFQIRRTTLPQMDEARRLREVARHVLGRASDRTHVDLNRVRLVAWEFYWRQSGNRGWKRYLWFNTVGVALFWFFVSRVLDASSNATGDRH